MFLKIPWIISRRRKLIASSIDFFTNIFLYNHFFNKEFGSYPSQLVAITFALFWIIVSYVFGRYVKISNVTLNGFTKALIKIIIILILSNMIYLIINWWLPLAFYWDKLNFSNQLSIELSNLFIRSSIYISICSLFIQYFFSIITYNIYNKKKEWILYGSKTKFREVIKEIDNDKKDIILTWVSNRENLELINFEERKGVIFANFNDINKNLDILFKLKSKGIIIIDLFSWFEKELNRMPTHIIQNKYQFIDKIKSIEDSYQLRAKRLADVLVSFFLLIISTPFFIVVSILIFIEDQGPLFYSQTRTGLNGDPFKIIKFRSMKVDAEKSGIQWSKNMDPRITRVGKLIRATRLDELPQLFCVIDGTMSLIGPRPERPEIEDEFLKHIPYYYCRNIIRPGISGWAQVNYPYGASIIDTTKKLSFDIYYIIHFSILLDFLILFKTIKLVMNAKGSKPKD